MGVGGIGYVVAKRHSPISRMQIVIGMEAGMMRRCILQKCHVRHMSRTVPGVVMDITAQNVLIAGMCMCEGRPISVFVVRSRVFRLLEQDGVIVGAAAVGM